MKDERFEVAKEGTSMEEENKEYFAEVCVSLKSQWTRGRLTNMYLPDLASLEAPQRLYY